MWNSLVLSVLSVLATATWVVEASPGEIGRVIGGDDADPGEYPYFVQGPGCAGALIAENLVLFAAHCGDLFLNQQLNIGAWRGDKTDEGAQPRFCDVWIFDDRYQTGCDPGKEVDINWDFAFCKLDKPVTNYTNTKNISVAINEDESVPELGDNLLVMGFGDTKAGFFAFNVPEIIQEAEVPYVTNQECNKKNRYDGEITDQMLCAGIIDQGGKDACQGDSGGPLVLRTTTPDNNVVDEIVGIVSWGIGCAKGKYPGVYSRVSQGAPWIKDKTCNELNVDADFCEGDFQPEEACAGDELVVTVKTDSNAGSTKWKLFDSSGTPIALRLFMVENTEYEHAPICLQPGCYEFEIEVGGNNGIAGGFYKGELNGAEVFSNPNGSFGKTATESFCTPGFEEPEPTEPPVGEPLNCVDSSPQCAIKLATQTKQKCNKNKDGEKVFNLCNATCALVNLGPCA